MDYNDPRRREHEASPSSSLAQDPRFSIKGPGLWIRALPAQAPYDRPALFGAPPGCPTPDVRWAPTLSAWSARHPVRPDSRLLSRVGADGGCGSSRATWTRYPSNWMTPR